MSTAKDPMTMPVADDIRYYYIESWGRWKLPPHVVTDEGARLYIRTHYATHGINAEIPYGRLMKEVRTCIYQHRPREGSSG